MKKKAFTVAEIFIALLTVGVLAALVLPTLMNNVKTTMYRHTRNVQRERISQGITMMSMRTNRFSYGRSDAFLNDLQRFMKISKICSDTNIADCWPYEIKISDDGPLFNMVNATSSEVFGMNNTDPEGHPATYTDDNAAFVTDTGLRVLFNFNSSCQPNTANLNRNCYVALIDLNGESKPNDLGKDVVLINAHTFNDILLSSDCGNSGNNFLGLNSPGGNGDDTESSGAANSNSCRRHWQDDDDD